VSTLFLFKTQTSRKKAQETQERLTCPQITPIKQMKKRGIATKNTRMHKEQSQAFSLWFFVPFRG
jgi:hypothetical protein